MGYLMLECDSFVNEIPLQKKIFTKQFSVIYIIVTWLKKSLQEVIN